MHRDSYRIMRYFVETYLDSRQQYDILDVGSYDVNGSYKPLFNNPLWKYTGLDIEAGPNVDVVSKGNYDFGLDKQYDVIVSGNCLEHVENPQQWIWEVEKYVKPGGIVCIITPFTIPEHRFPLDCWRILPDAYRYMMEKQAGFEIIETRINPHVKRYKFMRLIPLPAKCMNLLPVWVGSWFEYFNDQTIDDTYVVARRK